MVEPDSSRASPPILTTVLFTLGSQGRELRAHQELVLNSLLLVCFYFKNPTFFVASKSKLRNKPESPTVVSLEIFLFQVTDNFDRDAL